MLRELVVISQSRSPSSESSLASAGANNNNNASPSSEPPVAIISDIVGDPDRGEIPLDGDGDNDDEMDSAFEGNSSMTAQTVFASEFLENAVTQTSLSPSMESALSSLRQIVCMQNRKRTNQDSRFPNAKPMPRGGMRELPMPPSPVVVGILRDIKSTETLNLLCLVRKGVANSKKKNFLLYR